MTQRSWRTVGVVSSVTCFALVMTSGASAIHFPNQHSLKLRGSNGYTIVASGDPNAVTVTAKKGPSTATYSPEPSKHGVATAKRMQVDLGTFGGVDVRFHVKRTRMVGPPKGCTGKKAPKMVGTWKGPIDLDGENGFTSAHARKAKGTVLLSHRWDCRGRGAGHGVELLGYGGEGQYGAIFAARRPAHSASTEVIVGRFKELDGGSMTVGVNQTVDVTGSATAFTFNSQLTTAHVDPGSPFTGSANYESPNSWSGSLAVTLPGDTKPTELTKPGTVESLKRGRFIGF